MYEDNAIKQKQPSMRGMAHISLLGDSFFFAAPGHDGILTPNTKRETPICRGCKDFCPLLRTANKCQSWEDPDVKNLGVEESCFCAWWDFAVAMHL